MPNKWYTGIKCDRTNTKFCHLIPRPVLVSLFFEAFCIQSSQENTDNKLAQMFRLVIYYNVKGVVFLNVKKCNLFTI